MPSKDRFLRHSARPQPNMRKWITVPFVCGSLLVGFANTRAEEIVSDRYTLTVQVNRETHLEVPSGFDWNESASFVTEDPEKVAVNPESTQATAVIRGSYSDRSAHLVINGKDIDRADDGTFEFRAPLREKSVTLQAEAWDSKKKVRQLEAKSITIYIANRIQSQIGMQTLQSFRSEFFLNYESWSLPLTRGDVSAERVGIASVGTSINHGPFFLGFGFLAAVKGNFGGYNGIFLSGGLKQEIGKYVLLRETLEFGGAGGVGLLVSGGGMFYRGALTANVRLGKKLELGPGISYVSFPNGTLRSVQPRVDLRFPTDFTTLFEPNPRTPRAESSEIAAGDRDLKAVYRRWRVFSMMKGISPIHGEAFLVKNSGKAGRYTSIMLLGVSAEHYLNEKNYAGVNVYGGISSVTSGYLLFEVSGGRYFDISRLFAFNTRLNLGAAGGGGVAVGGGLVAEPEGLLVIGSGYPFQGQVGLGYYVPIADPAKQMRGYTINVGIGGAFQTLETSEPPTQTTVWSAEAKRKKVEFRFKTGVQRYLFQTDRTGIPGVDKQIHLLNIGFEYLLRRPIYISGDGSWPIIGGASGYAAGMIGVGAELDLFSRNFYWDPHARVGAAAGGGIDVGKSKLLMTGLGIGWRADSNLSMRASLEHLDFHAGKHGFGAELGIKYGFNFAMN